MASTFAPAFATRYLGGLADRHSAADIDVHLKESAKTYFVVSADTLMNRQWTD